MPISIAANSLYAQLGLPQAELIVDVRKQAAFDETPRMLPGALRSIPNDIATWARQLPKSKPILVYCAHGHQVSQEAATKLDALSFNAGYLEGGIADWIVAGLPTVTRRPEYGVSGDGIRHSRWITRERPKIDRLACPWLVRRFIDPPHASFFYAPAPEVRTQAAALRAQPYDIPDTIFSHRGPLCSFDAFLAEFNLHDPVLDSLAHIERAADTGELHSAHQAPGLLAISLGLCVNITDDDALLEAAMPVYDALYAWCKTAKNETHNWPFGPKP